MTEEEKMDCFRRSFHRLSLLTRLTHRHPVSDNRCRDTRLVPNRRRSYSCARKAMTSVCHQAGRSSNYRNEGYKSMRQTESKLPSTFPSCPMC